jgi:3' terminal RNA ribose 2'-O-methyltransferase Hen1
MLIQLTCYAANAPEIGYLLAKNPASVFERDFSAGTAWVFYPEVADDHITVALVTEIDPIGLVRGPAALAGLDQYVNDRPYVASSLTSVALNLAFRTAMSGESQSLPARLGERLRWVVELPAIACDAGDEFSARLFTPLGYTVAATRLPLDVRFPEWGQSELYHLRLEGEQTVRDVLNHLYVLLPVLDNAKHYYVAASELEKLLARGDVWLAAHPERELIARRYLRYQRPLVTSALARLAENEPASADDPPSDEEISAGGSDATASTEAAPVEKEPGLHEQRLEAVLRAVRDSGARTLVDLGCGEGKLLALALKERHLTRLLGIDVSSVALARARRRLRLDTLPPAQRERIELTLGSLLYRDARLAGFDAAALVEVIEHLDAPRLGAMERVVFEHAQPRRVIVTTPNREYNPHWEALGETRLRHVDHRFEWTRAEGQAWAARVATSYGYTAQWSEVGPLDPTLGAPSQMVIFDRRGAGQNATADGGLPTVGGERADQGDEDTRDAGVNNETQVDV